VGGAVLRFMLKSKIHRARVTAADLHYPGSITIDPDLIEMANLYVHEQVHVLDIDNGARFETYVIEGERGGRAICLNGAAARLALPGDRIIVLSYAMCTDAEAREHAPIIVVCDERNEPTIVGLETAVAGVGVP